MGAFGYKWPRLSEHSNQHICSFSQENIAVSKTMHDTNSALSRFLPASSPTIHGARCITLCMVSVLHIQGASIEHAPGWICPNTVMITMDWLTIAPLPPPRPNERMWG